MILPLCNFVSESLPGFVIYEHNGSPGIFSWVCLATSYHFLNSCKMTLPTHFTLTAPPTGGGIRSFLLDPFQYGGDFPQDYW